MSFNVTEQASKMLENVGVFSQVAVGITALEGGSVTFTIKELSRVDGIVGNLQSGNIIRPVRCSATASSSVTLEVATGDTEPIMWMAWGKPIL